MGRLKEIIGIVNELREVFPDLVELIKCFRQLSPEAQESTLRVLSSRVAEDEDEGYEMLSFMLKGEK